MDNTVDIYILLRKLYEQQEKQLAELKAIRAALEKLANK